MKILRTKNNQELTKKEGYALMHSNHAEKVSDHIDEIVEVVKFAFYEEDTDPENIKNILSFIDVNGKIYGTNSDSFKRSFENVLDFFEDEETIPILIFSGTSKNGRTFIICDYAG